MGRIGTTVIWPFVRKFDTTSKEILSNVNGYLHEQLRKPNSDFAKRSGRICRDQPRTVEKWSKQATGITPQQNKDKLAKEAQPNLQATLIFDTASEHSKKPKSASSNKSEGNSKVSIALQNIISALMKEDLKYSDLFTFP